MGDRRSKTVGGHPKQAGGRRSVVGRKSGGADVRVLVFLGGIRSGKSAAALERFKTEIAVRKLKAPVYLATLASGMVHGDLELVRRVAAHRSARPSNWAVVEAEADLSGAARRCLKARNDAWILDGLGAWAALRLGKPEQALSEFRAFLEKASGVPLLVLVLDEVGQGGVPGHPAARAFCDLNGALNQYACSRADAVWTLQAGLALRLK